jgi:hypothetical protein
LITPHIFWAKHAGKIPPLAGGPSLHGNIKIRAGNALDY